MGETVRNKVLTVRVTAKEHDAFITLCAASHQYQRPSDLLRAMLAKLLPKDFEPGEVSIEQRPRKSKSIFVTVDEEEAQKIRARARAECTTGPSWIRKIIRTVLFKEHQFSPEEVNVLRESNRELGHLGRNINQIARELHLSLNAAEQMNAQKLDDLYAQITEHRAQVTKLLNANWGRITGEE